MRLRQALPGQATENNGLGGQRGTIAPRAKQSRARPARRDRWPSKGIVPPLRPSAVKSRESCSSPLAGVSEINFQPAPSRSRNRRQVRVRAVPAERSPGASSHAGGSANSEQIRRGRLSGRPVSTPRMRSPSNRGVRAEPACGPGAHPRTPWRPPHADGALRKARVRVRPAARPAQNGTRQPPQRRRAAETVNVNVSCWSAPVLMDEGEAPGAMESYGAAVICCSRQSAAVVASIRSVAAWSTIGPDGVGMMTVMCCCRARWRAG